MTSTCLLSRANQMYVPQCLSLYVTIFKLLSNAYWRQPYSLLNCVQPSSLTLNFLILGSYSKPEARESVLVGIQIRLGSNPVRSGSAKEIRRADTMEGERSLPGVGGRSAASSSGGGRDRGRVCRAPSLC